MQPRKREKIERKRQAGYYKIKWRHRIASPEYHPRAASRPRTRPQRSRHAAEKTVAFPRINNNTIDIISELDFFG